MRGGSLALRAAGRVAGRAAERAGSNGRSVAAGLVRSTRPRQWVKNAFVFVPAVFGGTLVSQVGGLLLAVAAFCLVSSSLYLVNDVCDRESDRLHERTRRRPIASGQVGVRLAIATAVSLAAAGLGLAALASWATLGVLLAYLLSTLAYSLGLKQVVIVDVMLIALGFVLRMLGGAVATHTRVSMWLLLCMMFLALFLGFSKRRHDLLSLEDRASSHRPVLDEYTPQILNQFLVATMVATMLSYSLYALTSPSGAAHRGLLLTIPFAIFGILRYLLVAETSGDGASPEDLLLSDRPLQAAAAAWIAVVLLSLYVVPGELLMSVRWW
jgi:4-hydroxybenzoate polyprenyltransferase